MATGSNNGCENCGSACDVCGDGWALTPPMSRQRFFQEAVLRMVSALDCGDPPADHARLIKWQLEAADQLTAAVFDREEVGDGNCRKEDDHG